MLTKRKKDDIKKKLGAHDRDSGSTQVQIGLLTEEIRELASHMKKHKHDFSARRGLMRKIGQRKKFLIYLQREDASVYEELVKKLGIKHRAIQPMFKDEETEVESGTDELAVNETHSVTEDDE